MKLLSLQNRVNSLFRDLNEGEEPADHGQLCAGGRCLRRREEGRPEARSAGHRREGPGRERGKQHADRQGRAQVREGGEGRELPSHRAALRQLLSAPSRCPRPSTPRTSRPATMPACSSWSSKRSPKPSPSRSRSTWANRWRRKSSLQPPAASFSSCWSGAGRSTEARAGSRAIMPSRRICFLSAKKECKISLKCNWTLAPGRIQARS